MEEMALLEERVLQEKFKQQQALIQALVCTQRQLAAARDAALLEQLQMLSVAVGEARPMSKAGKRCHRFDDRYINDNGVDINEFDDDEEIVYRSVGGDDEEMDDNAVVTLENCEDEDGDVLVRQVRLLSQISEKLQAVGNELTPGVLQQLHALSVEMATLSVNHA
mmetsp:Transcript_63/g.159  ORF Transcript_63/g.159 Transcript_63/m.159 type:complete len:165 (-) Transcript_63:212-706(-)|eukprot:CAMPEP_0183336186 /NCGR_PEP_ID=MMETSP0164_2-20130417/4242_1 /TAXON_ID=221442 /ORGANISM="Coccolithus pelagicus ssp braarudi, Strain PLY182g" /LENGTH=164 /DNA_ID=CAMNT_0025505661 /DNA_START=140 /DNA_END=637 /DNA_ORIENTATION=-